MELVGQDVGRLIDLLVVESPLGRGGGGRFRNARRVGILQSILVEYLVDGADVAAPVEVDGGIGKPHGGSNTARFILSGKAPRSERVPGA